MAFNKDSNIFTFVFAISMCVLVAGVLAGTFSILQTDIKYNQSAKNMVDLLSAIEVDSSRETAEIDFDKYITGFVVLNSQGNKIDSLSNKSSALSIDIKKQYRDKTIKLEDKKFPLFIAEKNNQSFYIAPLIGTGLWGPIWGFVSFNEDGNTVTGASFDHKSETPGLGAEIREDFFEKQFIGQKILDSEGIFVSIAVMKGGANIDSYHEVDGITGGTITSDGVTDMLYENLSIYSKYLNK